MRCIAVLLLVATSFAGNAFGQQQGSPLSMADRAAKAVSAFAENHPDRTLVVGVLENGRRSYAATGESRAGRSADEHTLFEIGSISKTFAAIAMASMIEEGRISADQTVREFVPDEVILKDSVGAITLEQLATHTSGLPRVARTRVLKSIFSTTPYGGSRETLHFDLSLLNVEPSMHPAYSNLGVGLLGDILASVSDTDFESVCKTRITKPLGMADTVVDLSDEQSKRFAVGYFGRSVAKPWSNMGTAVAAGGIRSTASDLLTYAEAVIAAPDAGPLGGAIANAVRPRVRYRGMPWDVGLCWHSRREDVEEKRDFPLIVFHDGATYSHMSALMVNTDGKRAVVVFSNSLNVTRMPNPRDVAKQILEISDE